MSFILGWLDIETIRKYLREHDLDFRLVDKKHYDSTELLLHEASKRYNLLLEENNKNKLLIEELTNNNTLLLENINSQPEYESITLLIDKPIHKNQLEGFDKALILAQLDEDAKEELLEEMKSLIKTTIDESHGVITKTASFNYYQLINKQENGSEKN